MTAKFGLNDKAFAGVLSQWKRAALDQGLQASDRAVFAVQHATKPIQQLRAALARSKATNPGPLSPGELKALTKLETLLPELSQIFQRRLREIASVLVVPDEIDTLGIAVLAGGVVSPEQGPQAWEALKTIARQLARDRAGLSIAEWAARLTSLGVILASDRSGTPAARWQATHLALRRYRASLVRKATSLDLIGFGVALPPIRHRLDRFTFQVLDPADTDRQSERDLARACRRRGRVVITGLPGSGKSTALTYLAADLARDMDGPLPVRINLKEFHRLLADLTPIDAVVRLAERDTSHEDRSLVADEIRRTAVNGNLALLFDALDETRRERLKVVGAIRRLSAEVHEDVEFVVSTRDVGYADAKRVLEFRELRLASPKDTGYTLRQILRAFARSHGATGDSNEAWIAERHKWVSRALERDKHLAETPLGGILLAVLVGEGRQKALPEGRAATLSAIVDNVVERWEAARTGDQRVVGSLSGVDATGALRESFARIGWQLLQTEQLSFDQLATDLSRWLRHRWGLAPGPADGTAVEIAHFWDEAGVFIARDTAALVAPRLQLLSEIGAARYLAALSQAEQSVEIEKRLRDDGVVEVLSLAAGLSKSFSDLFVNACVNEDALSWDLKAAKHIHEGGGVSDSALLQLSASLARRFANGDEKDAWRAAKAIAVLPVELARKRELLKQSEPILPASKQLLIIGMSEAAAGVEVSGAADLLIAAREHLRPGGSELKPRGGGGFTLVAPDEEIARLVLRIAETSMQSEPTLAELVSEAARKGRADFFERINGLIYQAGRADVATKWLEGMADSMRQFGDGIDRMHQSWMRFLAIIAEQSVPRSLTPGESRRLDAITDFIGMLRIGESYAGAIIEAMWTPEDVKELVRLTIALGGFEPALLAAQARLATVIEERTQRSLSLVFDAPQPPPMERWNGLREEDARTLVRLLRNTEWIADVASRALGSCPFEGIERAIESDFGSMPPTNRLLAGNALLTLDRDMEGVALRLFQSLDPFVRRIAGYWFGTKAATGFLQRCLDALVDLDAGVRDAAIDGLAGIDLSPELVAAVERVAADPVGFTCLRCETVNEAGRSSCAKCNLVSAEPQAAARKLLEALRSKVPA